jgi:hypothetical protein
MKGRRTGIDFSEHEVLVTKNEDFLMHHLKIPGTIMNSIKFINTNGIMAVTGDFGNWIFCREFHPSANKDTRVSDGYWHEKLSIASTQEAEEFDGDATKAALKEKLEEYKLEMKDEGIKPNEDVIEYYEECMNKCDEHELDYSYYAYREQPAGFDYDDVILIKDYKMWLKYIFDGFEEICRRMKEEAEQKETAQTTA